MEVDAADGAGALVEADVVEALEAGARDGRDLVVRHEEVFLPPHEEVFALGKVLEGEAGGFGLFAEGPPRGEAVPVLHVDLLRGAPFGVCGLEGVLVADDLAFKVGGQGRVVVR